MLLPPGTDPSGAALEPGHPGCTAGTGQNMAHKHAVRPTSPIEPGSFSTSFLPALPARCLRLCCSFDSFSRPFPLRPVHLNLRLCHLIYCTSPHTHTPSSSSSSSSHPSGLGSGISNRLKSAWPAQASSLSPPPFFSSSSCLCVPACLGYIG